MSPHSPSQYHSFDFACFPLSFITTTPTSASSFFHNTRRLISFLMMLDFLFGWRKASTCKRLIRRIECRLNLLNSKRRAIVRQVRDDLGLLLKLGHHDQTILFTRVEQLYMDEIIITVYELLCHFTQFISINLSCIHRHHKHCPTDVNEAISSLIFASARCGDVPELRDFRDLIQQQFGHRFVRTALQLLPGNLVNDQVKEKLSITSVSEDAKFRMVNDIYRDYCLPSTSLGIQYSQEWHQKQAKEDITDLNYAIIPDKQIKHPNEMQIDATMTPDKQITYKYEVQRDATNSVSEDCFSLQSKHLASTFRNNQGIVLPAQDTEKVTAMENLAPMSRIPSSSSCSDVSVNLLDENLVYLDDIEEFRSPKLYDCSSPDTRVFMFKSPPLVNVQSDQYQLQSRMRGRLRRTKSRKVRNMASSRESVNLGQDVESTDVADNNKNNSSEALRQEIHPRNAFKDASELFSDKRGKSQSPVNIGVRLCDDTSNRRTKCIEHHDQSCHSRYLYKAGSITEQTVGINKQKEVMKKRAMHEDVISSPKSSNGSNSVAAPSKSSALTCYVKDAETRYLRAFTMPAPQRPKDQGLETYSRTCSLPVPPNHVHPKLPDCDQIEAKFSALKKVYQHTQCH